ncbi:MAG: deoxyribose-phosphate aldolase [Spirochaetales bacterium]|nr:deoxyribose-phosphate aldolase [Spirochaetales bacterium]
MINTIEGVFFSCANHRTVTVTVFVNKKGGLVDVSCDMIARMIDHSLLAPYLTEKELIEGIEYARGERVASVCVMPFFLRSCAGLLEGSPVKPTATIGFPHGAHHTIVKMRETEQALRDGAVELDMVVNISKVRSGDWEYVTNEIASVASLVHESGKKIKVIFENCYLGKGEKIRLCTVCGELNVDWVKTSTGYGSGGATIEDVELMRKYSPPHVTVKAAGGIRDLDTLLAMRKSGATRIGATRTREILEECRTRLQHKTVTGDA